MPDKTLEELEAEYREAHEAYENDQTDENHDRYREAKLAFTQARVERRQSEELDPEHSRGNGLVVVENEE